MLKQNLSETVDYLQSKINLVPEIGVVLGSGLGMLANSVDDTIEIDYNEIPHFPVSTVQGHGGKLIFGKIEGKNVMLLSGRFHYYEGYDMNQVTYPVRVMKALGCHTLMVSNAAGGLHPDFQVGDIMIINDHINLFPEHPLRGPNDDKLGPRFPDMSEPYNRIYISQCKEIAKSEGILVYEGVYVGLQGPTFETRAEYRYLRKIGGDAVGMSTVPEVIVGIHAGMKVFGVSVITDIGIREELNTITHEEVLEAAKLATPKVTLLMHKLIGRI